MGQVLHRGATTTEAVRRAIQHSQESLRVLARRHGINQKTVAKWRKRCSVADLPTVSGERSGRLVWRRCWLNSEHGWRTRCDHCRRSQRRRRSFATRSHAGVPSPDTSMTATSRLIIPLPSGRSAPSLWVGRTICSVDQTAAVRAQLPSTPCSERHVNRTLTQKVRVLENHLTPRGPSSATSPPHQTVRLS